MRPLFVLAIGLLLATSALGAQPVRTRAEVGVRIGRVIFAKGTALEPTTFVGVDASWDRPWSPARLREHAPTLGVGVSLDVSRPRTDGTQFPLAAVDQGDTTWLYAMAQRVTLVESSVQAQVGIPLAGARIVGYAGGGLYAMLLGAQATGHSSRMVHPMGRVGLAVDDPVSRTLRVRLQVGGVTYLHFDRRVLDVTSALPAERRIRDAAPPAAATSRTPTNVQVSLTLRFTPGGP